MTVKYASPTAKAEAKVRAANKNVTAANAALASANARRNKAADAAEKWSEKWPQLTEIEGRPLYQGADGMAVDVEGNAVWIEDGPNLRQANLPDIYVSPPPSIEEIDALEKNVAKALKAQTKAVSDAGKVEPEKLEPTGYAVIKAGRIAGTFYSRNDAFPPEQVSPAKFDQLLRNRHIRRTGNA